MPKAKGPTTRQVAIPPDLYSQLQAIAERDYRTVHAVIIMAIRDGLARREALEARGK